MLSFREFIAEGVLKPKDYEDFILHVFNNDDRFKVLVHNNDDQSDENDEHYFENAFKACDWVEKNYSKFKKDHSIVVSFAHALSEVDDVWLTYDGKKWKIVENKDNKWLRSKK